MKSKYLAGASAGILLAFGVAQTAGAADLPVEIPVVEPVPVSPLWSGFYVGAQVGYVFGADINRNANFNDIDRRGRRIVDDIDECFDDEVPQWKRDKITKVIEELDDDDLPLELGDVNDAIADVFSNHPYPPVFYSVQQLEAFLDAKGDPDCFVTHVGDRNDRAAFGPYSLHEDDDDGWEAGIYVGADAQFGQFVFGAIADINYIDLESDFVAIDSDGATAFVSNVDLDWYATLRARAGFAFDRFLAYAHGGLAYARIDVDGTGRDITFVTEDVVCDEEGCLTEEDIALVPASFNDDDDLWGYAVGVGAEALIRENVSAKLEYQYTNLGEETFGGLFDETESSEVEIDFHTVRLGVAFRF